MIISDLLFSEKISKKIKNQKIWTIGLSGGADSLCLTMLANNYAKTHNIKIFVGIVDHKLREESSTEILPIIEILNKHNIEYKVFIWEHPHYIGGNIEQKARIVRYDFLYNFCKKVDSNVLMTAHHALDQWETFFMRLSRGSALKGLSCIKEISEFKDILLVRPILEFYPSDILETLIKRFGIKEYVNDPSNKQPKFERTKWRSAYKELSEKYNLNMMSVNKSIKRMQNSNDCIDDMARKFIPKIFDGTYIKLDEFKELHLELKIRILDIIINMLSPNEKHIISYELLQRISNSICLKEFTAINLSGLILRRDRTENIKIYLENERHRLILRKS